MWRIAEHKTWMRILHNKRRKQHSYKYVSGNIKLVSSTLMTYSIVSNFGGSYLHNRHVSVEKAIPEFRTNTKEERRILMVQSIVDTTSG
jgi:hypothetical protein